MINSLNTPYTDIVCWRNAHDVYFLWQWFDYRDVAAPNFFLAICYKHYSQDENVLKNIFAYALIVFCKTQTNTRYCFDQSRAKHIKKHTHTQIAFQTWPMCEANSVFGFCCILSPPSICVSYIRSFDNLKRNQFKLWTDLLETSVHAYNAIHLL